MTKDSIDNNNLKKDKAKGFLGKVEYYGNKLPDPFILFVMLTAILLVITNIVSMTGVSVIHPGTGEELAAKALISADGLRYIVTSFVSNFQTYAPLGIVLVMVAAVGVAEKSGLVSSIMKRTLQDVSDSVMVPVIIWISVMGNIASDAAMVIVPPIAAMIYLGRNKNPLIGLAMSYGAMAAGWSANFLIGTVDAVLAPLSETAGQLIDPNITVPIVANWYMNIGSAIVVTLVGTFVTIKIVEPRLKNAPWHFDGVIEMDEKKLSDKQEKGLKKALVSVLIYVAIVALLVIPKSGLLRDPETAGVLRSPFMSGLVFLLFLFFLIPGITYGYATDVFSKKTKGKDIVDAMTDSTKTMAGYIVLVIIAAQFLNYFGESNLAIILAVNGAEFLESTGLSGLVLSLGVIAFSAFINLFIGSASAKWAMFAPIFVPMFMLLGFHPAFAQQIYRIGDSITNAITPLFSYFPIILGYMKRYTGEGGIGTLISTLLPYSIGFGIGWTILLIIFYVLKLPLGPGGPIFL